MKLILLFKVWQYKYIYTTCILCIYTTIFRGFSLFCCPSRVHKHIQYNTYIAFYINIHVHTMNCILCMLYFIHIRHIYIIVCTMVILPDIAFRTSIKSKMTGVYRNIHAYAHSLKHWWKDDDGCDEYNTKTRTIINRRLVLITF